MLVNAPHPAKLIARETLSYIVEGAQYTNAGAAGWSGRNSFFDFDKSKFPAGFVWLIYKALVTKGFKVQIARKPYPEPLGPEHPKVDSFPEDPRYDYQPDIVRRLLKHGQMIAQVATGGGKSRIAKLAYARIGRPTMFLTTRSSLLHQMKNAVERDMGEKVSVIGDDYAWPDHPRPFTCAMVQTLAQAIEYKTVPLEFARWKKNRDAAEDRAIAELCEKLKKQHEKAKTPVLEAHNNILKLAGELRDRQKAAREPEADVLERFKRSVPAHNAHREKVIAFLMTRELVLLEEAHEASSNSYYDIMSECKNAHYRLALTATPFMKDSAEANMRLMACSGPVAVRVSEAELIKRGVLAKPYFIFEALSRCPDDLYRTTPYQRAYELGIVEATERNNRIVMRAKQANAYGLSIMVLVQRQKHGKTLALMLTEAGLKVNFIFGEHKQNERQAALDALADGRIDVLIGSTILDVGVDVPSVGMIIVAGAGKAEVGTRQRIGRGLRSKKHGPNVAFIVDFTDTWNSHLRDHARDRFMIVQTTDGFREGIVNDFDYEALGFTRLAAAA